MMIKISNKYNITHPYNHRGFTLAETLITLVVIGVVAALTVPNLIVKHQKEETVTKLKKAYTTIAQTTKKAIADHGPLPSWEVKSNKTKEFVEQYMAPYLNIAKDCGYDTTGDCNYEYAELKTPNTKTPVANTYYRFFLTDGTLILLRISAGNAVRSENQGGEFVPVYYWYNAMANVLVDINGLKGPNRYGRDLFQFRYYIQDNQGPYGDNSGKLIPFGNTSQIMPADYYKRGGCSDNTTGKYCAGMIMASGWQITDDYPW